MWLWQRKWTQDKADTAAGVNRLERRVSCCRAPGVLVFNPRWQQNDGSPFHSSYLWSTRDYYIKSKPSGVVLLGLIVGFVVVLFVWGVLFGIFVVVLDALLVAVCCPGVPSMQSACVWSMCACPFCKPRLQCLIRHRSFAHFWVAYQRKLPKHPFWEMQPGIGFAFYFHFQQHFCGHSLLTVINNRHKLTLCFLRLTLLCEGFRTGGGQFCAAWFTERLPHREAKLTCWKQVMKNGSCQAGCPPLASSRTFPQTEPSVSVLQYPKGWGWLQRENRKWLEN